MVRCQVRASLIFATKTRSVAGSCSVVYKCLKMPKLPKFAQSPIRIFRPFAAFRMSFANREIWFDLRAFWRSNSLIGHPPGVPNNLVLLVFTMLSAIELAIRNADGVALDNVDGLAWEG